MEYKKKNKNDDLLHLVSFRLGKDEFGVDILNVYEIIRVVKITAVPNAPIFIEGIVNMRGKVVPIIDLRVKLGLEKKDYDSNTRIIVTQINEYSIGFIVDAVNEVLRIPDDIIEEPPSILSGINSDYIKSIGKLDDRILILINLEKILSENETEELKKVA